ncbi:DivIVA domain-containing protein [Lactobacillus sp. PV037]|uniref:DivIVA domain-containing protein n=1 Tax=unclassified Lactobacillus TaxID=2620435 RepID=UPI00223F4457|nr:MULTISPECIES: DivIVA domain-containing protein [unclassified Lactobacillus]QNQ82454.1 DivIVA domain-containing protein [Lactobacillus sp. PV012]QNQ83432.1 DivIVA domain-containing protein [Lactobacillus sp. PV037]
MARLTPMNIHEKQFQTKFKGYDVDEVDGYLDQIVNDYGDVLDENVDLKNKIAHLEEQNQLLTDKTKEYDELKETLNRSLIAAQKLQEEAEQNSAKIVEDGQKQAQEIVEKAKGNAEDLDKNLKQEYTTLSEDYELLKKKVSNFRSEMKKQLQEQLDALSDDSWQYELDEYYGRSRLYPGDGSQPIAQSENELESKKDSETEKKSNENVVIDKSSDNEVQSESTTAPKIVLEDKSSEKQLEVNSSQNNNGPKIIFPDENKKE